MLLAMAILVVRAIFLQVFDTQFLQKEANRRHIGLASVPAYRGEILDRHGEPLAISTPVESIEFRPKYLFFDRKGKKRSADIIADEKNKLRQAAELLGVWNEKIQGLLRPENKIRFTYLKRRVNPELAEKIKDLNIKGVSFRKEFKRFYPAGATSAHIVGFTNLDDVGQEGMERVYERSLKGIAGKKRVVRDGKRRIIKDIESVKNSVSGKNLTLSIDQRLQYIAFKALEAGVDEHKAKSASLVVLDAKTGEVLAAVNQPAFNPNTRKGLKGALYRNRAMLDVFEPGSTVKPFVIAAALEGGFISEHIVLETDGRYKIGRHFVRDGHNYGMLDLTGVLKKSSNIGVSKISLLMPREYLWGKYNELGFGMSANVGFPGESSGTLLDFLRWNDFVQATLSYGYGLSVTTLQLARAYTALADDGMLHSVTLLKRDEDDESQRIFSAEIAQQVRGMLEHVLEKDGTAYQARVDGYRVSGKTGTSKKAIRGGYSNKLYSAVFVGMAPASNPRFVIAVMVNEPSAGKYYGGQVAGPVFSKVMAGALRLYGVAPDKEETMPVLLTD
jgi:cell division protein FtsI (penicillin-binding protein 3)